MTEPDMPLLPDEEPASLNIMLEQVRAIVDAASEVDDEHHLVIYTDGFCRFVDPQFVIIENCNDQRASVTAVITHPMTRADVALLLAEKFGSGLKSEGKRNGGEVE
jgi:hypothetical protein